jgi:hypothetical protein
MLAPYQELQQHWKMLGLRLSRGNSEDAIHLFEARNGIVLPRDIHDYFLNVNGMLEFAGHDCDPNGFSFWPLSRVKNLVRVYAEEHINLPNLAEPEKYYVFADYLQWSWAYAIRLGKQPSEPHEVVHAGTMVPKKVASSFADFVELYLANAPNLYPDREPTS